MPVPYVVSTGHTSSILATRKVLPSQAFPWCQWPLSLLRSRCHTAPKAECSEVTLPQDYPAQTYDCASSPEWHHLKAILRTRSFNSFQCIIIGLFCGPWVLWIVITVALVRKLPCDPVTRNSGIIYCIITPLNWKQLITWSRMHKWKFIRGKWWKMCPLL